MGALARAFSAPTRGFEWKTAADTLELFKQIFGSNESSTGESITFDRALQVATVFACVRVVANGLSQVPLKLYRRQNRAQVDATDHPLYWALYVKPNPWQTSVEFRQTMAAHLMLCGNHFAVKNVVNGRVMELLQVEPGRVEVDRLRNGNLTYKVKFGDAPAREVPQEAMWHVRALSWNSWMGMEPVKYAREAIGLSLATERQQARFFKNGAAVSGTYSVPNKLSKDQYRDLRDWIVENTSGENSGAPLILDNSATWLSRTMTSVDAQLDETRRRQVEEVCRALGVFPQMVGQSDKTSTFASAEAFFIAHVVHTLAPYYTLIEQSIAVHLLSDTELRTQGLFAKFVEEGLLRGSIKDTSDVLDKYVNGGLMTPNEGRSKLDLNPDADPASDKLRVPANIVGKADPAAVEAEAASQQKSQRREDEWHAARMLELRRQQPAPVVNVTSPSITVSPPAITVNTPAVKVEAPHVNVAPPSIQVDAPQVTVTPPTINVAAPVVNISPPEFKAGDVHVTTPPVNVEAPIVNIAPPAFTAGDVHVTLPEGAVKVDVKVAPAEVHTGDLSVTLPAPVVTPIVSEKNVATRTRIKRDANGEIVETTTTPVQ